MVQPIWSATTCDFPGAGVYIGLAPQREHALIGQVLSPKRLRAVLGGDVRFGPEGSGAGSCPLTYYAVRDPSVVRVIPVDRPPLPNGFKHVKLSFKLERIANLQQILSDLGTGATSAGQATAAFIMTIGLPLAREEWFFREAIASHPRQDFTDLYTRLRELGCDDNESDGR